MYSERTIANAFNKRFVGPLAGLLDSAGASVVFMCNEFTKRRLLAWTIFHHAYYKILQTLLLAF